PRRRTGLCAALAAVSGARCGFYPGWPAECPPQRADAALATHIGLCRAHVRRPRGSRLAAVLPPAPGPCTPASPGALRWPYAVREHRPEIWPGRNPKPAARRRSVAEGPTVPSQPDPPWSLQVIGEYSQA